VRRVGFFWLRLLLDLPCTMKALKLKVMIGGDRRLVLDMPDEVEEGPAEVIVLVPERAQRPSVGGLEAHVERLMARPRGRAPEEIDAELRAERESWD
jgi:hypothetical protein